MTAFFLSIITSLASSGIAQFIKKAFSGGGIKVSKGRIFLSGLFYVLMFVSACAATWIVYKYFTTSNISQAILGFYILSAFLLLLWLFQGFTIFTSKDMNTTWGVAIASIFVVALFSLPLFLSIIPGVTFLWVIAYAGSLLGFVVFGIFSVMAYPWSERLVKSVLPELEVSLKDLKWLRDEIAVKFDTAGIHSDLWKEIDELVIKISDKLPLTQPRKLNFSEIKALYALKKESTAEIKQFSEILQTTLQKHIAGTLGDLQKNDDFPSDISGLFENEKKDIISGIYTHDLKLNTGLPSEVPDVNR
jgi:hypothetical protein